MSTDRPDWLRSTTVEMDLRTIVLGDTSSPTEEDFTVAHAMMGVYCEIALNAGGGGGQWTVAVQNVTKGWTSRSFSKGTPLTGPAGYLPAHFLIPIYSSPQDAMKLLITANSGGAYGVNAWTFTQFPGALAVTAGGLLHPHGDWSSAVFSSTSPGNVVIAPPTPLRLLIKSAWIQSTAGAQLRGTIGAQLTTLAFTGGSADAAKADCGPQGQLLDSGSPLAVLNTGTTQAFAAAIYDIVA